MPWPISALRAVTVTTLSTPMLTKALGASGEVPAACLLAQAVMIGPAMTASVRPAPALRTPRRLRSGSVFTMCFMFLIPYARAAAARLMAVRMRP